MVYETDASLFLFRFNLIRFHVLGLLNGVSFTPIYLRNDVHPHSFVGLIYCMFIING